LSSIFIVPLLLLNQIIFLPLSYRKAEQKYMNNL